MYIRGLNYCYLFTPSFKFLETVKELQSQTIRKQKTPMNTHLLRAISAKMFNFRLSKNYPAEGLFTSFFTVLKEVTAEGEDVAKVQPGQNLKYKKYNRFHCGQ